MGPLLGKKSVHDLRPSKGQGGIDGSTIVEL